MTHARLVLKYIAVAATTKGEEVSQLEDPLEVEIALWAPRHPRTRDAD